MTVTIASQPSGFTISPTSMSVAVYVAATPTLEPLTVALTAGDGKVTLAPQTAAAGFTFHYASSNATAAAPAYGANISTVGTTTAYTTSVDITGTNGTPMFVRVYKVNGSNLIVGFGEASATPTATPNPGGGLPPDYPVINF